MSAQPPPPEEMPVSARFSFKGWLFSVWLVKNAAYVKTVIALLFSALSVIFAAGNGEALRQALLAFGAGFVSLAAKCALDAFDYFVKENPR